MSFDPITGEARRKFQHRYPIHIILFLATLASATLVGAYLWIGFQQAVGLRPEVSNLTTSDWIHGLWYSVPALLILLAHEFGHYIYCRIHNVDATLPYFLPFPPILIPSLFGTLGAVIKIKEPFPSVRALFDIGIAGPIGGFIVLVPLLYLGVSMSAVVRFPEDANLIYFGEPLLLQAFASMHFGVEPAGFDLTLHPLGFAAWFGLLATALNLLPFGQLDGGHIAYAVFGRRARVVSMLTLGGTLLLTLRTTSWISMALLMLVMAYFLGLRHPHVPDEGTPLDPGRKVLALVALVIFVISFTPVPIEFFLGTQ